MLQHLEPMSNRTHSRDQTVSVLDEIQGFESRHWVCKSWWWKCEGQVLYHDGAHVVQSRCINICCFEVGMHNTANKPVPISNSLSCEMLFAILFHPLESTQQFPCSHLPTGALPCFLGQKVLHPRVRALANDRIEAQYSSKQAMNPTHPESQYKPC